MPVLRVRQQYRHRRLEWTTSVDRMAVSYTCSLPPAGRGHLIVYRKTDSPDLPQRRTARGRGAGNCSMLRYGRGHMDARCPSTGHSVRRYNSRPTVARSGTAPSSSSSGSRVLTNRSTRRGTCLADMPLHRIYIYKYIYIYINTSSRTVRGAIVGHGHR